MPNGFFQQNLKRMPKTEKSEDQYQILRFRNSLQSFAKYSRQLMFSCDIAHYGKSSIFAFQDIFTITDKIFIS